MLEIGWKRVDRIDLAQDKNDRLCEESNDPSGSTTYGKYLA